MTIPKMAKMISNNRFITVGSLQLKRTLKLFQETNIIFEK